MEEVFISKQLPVLDTAVHDWITSHRNPESRSFFLILTDFGKSLYLAVAVPLVALALWRWRKRVETVIFVGGFTLAAITVAVLKSLLARPRPADAALLHEISGSFPSSHAALSVFFYGLLAYILANALHHRSRHWPIFACGLLIAVAISFSRVYLNAHWLSDVLGGFALGATFLSAAILILNTAWIYSFIYNGIARQRRLL